MIKLGLDIHGVIDRDPAFFSYLTSKIMDKPLLKERNEVHIITGREICDEIMEKLERYNIHYTHVFSITSYHKKIGTYIAYKDGDPTQPLIAPPVWDRTKAEYCERNKIDIHIDDSIVYGSYFVDIHTHSISYMTIL